MRLKIFAASLLSVLIVAGCHTWDNFTTYFNTYYNMERLLKECEMEFDYQDEKKRVMPRTFVPEPQIRFDEVSKDEAPRFLKEFIIEPQKLQPVRIKLDSIIVKGSKVLAKHPNSDYVEGTLYMMALVYFYRSEWIPSQVKCSELIDKFPDGDLSPDAHLLMAKNYLIRRKFEAGKTLLSRCVDIAWQKERYDILSEAFRLEAEVALYQNDEDGALKPYLQAIAQADDGLLRAKWQTDLAVLLFRMHRFEEAEKEFRKVDDFSPDYMAEFEAYLYRASSLMRLGEFDESLEILDELEDDGNNEEWLSFIFAQRMNWLRLQNMDEDYKIAEDFADSAFTREPPVMTALFEKGVELFDSSKYSKARNYFSRTRTIRSPVKDISEKLYQLLNQWEQKQSVVHKMSRDYYKTDSIPEAADSMKNVNDIKDYYYAQMEQKVFTADRDTSLSDPLLDGDSIKPRHMPTGIREDLGEAEVQQPKKEMPLPAPGKTQNEPELNNFNPSVKSNAAVPPGMKPQPGAALQPSMPMGTPSGQPAALPMNNKITGPGITSDSNLKKYNIQPIEASHSGNLPENKPQEQPLHIPREKQSSRPAVPKPAISYPLYEIGRVHDQLGNKDSARYYYELALHLSPPESDMTAKYLYVYAESLRGTDLKKSDSLMELLVEFYPLTEYGTEAMKLRGYTEAFVIDSAEELYTSGVRLREADDYSFAFEQFRTVFLKFPRSKYAPRSLYNIGWTYETDLKNYDSALYYYNILQEKYPNTVYALDVNLTVAYLSALRSGKPLPDSLKPRDIEPYVPKSIELPVYHPPVEQEKPKEKEEDFNIMNIFSDPSSIIDEAEKTITKPVDDVQKQVKSVKDSVTDPQRFIPKLPDNPLDKIPKSDSTETNIPDSTGTAPPDSTKK